MGRGYLLVEMADAAVVPGAAADDTLLASLAAFRRAVELNPRNDEARHQYGPVLGFFSDSASRDGLRRARRRVPALDRPTTFSGGAGPRWVQAVAHYPVDSPAAGLCAAGR